MIKTMIKNIVNFFDRLEDKIRAKLIHHPVLYAFLGGVGIVLFWRGVWHTADEINLGSILSILIGSFILLAIGVFVSEFIGNRFIISGLIGERKLAEKEEGEIKTEKAQIKNLQNTLSRLEKKLDHIDEEIHEEEVEGK